MIKTKISNITVDQVLELVHELRQSGLIQGSDFSFSYSPTPYDGFSYFDDTKPYAEFIFHNEKKAALFLLKHSDKFSVKENG
jgi:hypothetical protein